MLIEEPIMNAQISGEKNARLNYLQACMDKIAQGLQIPLPPPIVYDMSCLIQMRMRMKKLDMWRSNIGLRCGYNL